MSDSVQNPQALIEGLDQVAYQMEQIWGVGRLRLLVSDFLRMKFDAQLEKLNTAIVENNPEFIAVQVDGMKRAWSALDKIARESGHRPLDPNVWETVMPTAGVAVAIVRTDVEAHALAKDRVVFTTAEIGQWLEQVIVPCSCAGTTCRACANSATAGRQRPRIQALLGGHRRPPPHRGVDIDGGCFR